MFRQSMLTLSLFTAFYANAESTDTVFQPASYTPSQMDFGGVGLIKMPTGRMAPEGEFNLSANINHEYRMYNASIALFPWFEATIRYAIVPNKRMGAQEFSGDSPYLDKGIDFKFRLLEESRWLPEVAAGVRDFGGTGLFDGEFIAASKKVYTNDYGVFDFTLGMGWGYMGMHGNVTNPFCKANDKFCERPKDFGGTGGEVDYHRWFKGPAAIYGGVEYQTPYQPLRLKMEYDTNDYSEDFPTRFRPGDFYEVDMTQHTPINVGLIYRAHRNIDLRLSYERGDTVSAGFSLRTNYNELASQWRDEPIPRPSHEQPENINEVDWKSLEKQLALVAGYEGVKVHVDDTTVIISGEQVKYRDSEIAHERAAAVLRNQLPKSINTYKVINTQQHITTEATDIDANKYDRVANVSYINPHISDASSVSTDTKVRGKQVHDGADRLYYGVSPTLRQSIAEPEEFYIFNLGVRGEASYWLTNQLQASSSIQVNLYDNYPELNFIVPPDGTTVPPRVRSLGRMYFHDNPVRMDTLQLTWFDNLGDSIYQQTYAGYLESMFAGVGTEWLYRPRGKNWAIGADINLVAQRDPDSWFGVYQQETQYSAADGRSFKVLDKGYTGFVSGYYMPKWSWLDDTLFKVDVGQYLAQDVGVRGDFSKQFKSGVIVGAYASLSNLSAEEFGEGSFTKGFYISIPFDVMTVKPSRNRAKFDWQPLTRDGGQKLNKEHDLFSLTDSASPWFTRKNTVPQP